MIMSIYIIKVNKLFVTHKYNQFMIIRNEIFYLHPPYPFEKICLIIIQIVEYIKFDKNN